MRTRAIFGISDKVSMKFKNASWRIETKIRNEAEMKSAPWRTCLDSTAVEKPARRMRGMTMLDDEY